MNELLKQLDEALDGFKGKSTDVRQAFPDAFDAPEPVYADVGGWLVMFADDEYPQGRSFRGPVAMALVGHEGMEPEAFRQWLLGVHYTVFPRQVAQPPFETEAQPSVDLRSFVFGGEYYPVIRAREPKTAHAFTQVISLVDDVSFNLLASTGVQDRVKGRVFKVSSLLSRFQRVAGQIIEPPSHQKTLGDVLDNISWPFGSGGIW